MGKMVGEVGKFVRRHYNEMKKLPVAGFIVSLAPGLKGPGPDGECTKGTACSLDPLHPGGGDHIWWQGGPVSLSWFQNWITKKVKSPGR